MNGIEKSLPLTDRAWWIQKRIIQLQDELIWRLPNINDTSMTEAEFTQFKCSSMDIRF